jgi:DNA-binding transcriptional ArsR family regulator
MPPAINWLIPREMTMRAKKAAAGKGAIGKGSGPQGTLTLAGLDQVRALADPLRVRMLGAFVEEHTTRQVAEILHEKPTRLYHHLKSLAEAGLIRKTRTRRNRGTLETYYRAVAGSFRADPSLFSPRGRPEATDSLGRMVDGMLDQTRAELRALIALGRGARGLEEEGYVSFLEVRTPERDMKKLRAGIERLVAGLQKDRPARASRGGKPAGADRRYRLTITFFPLDLEER